MRALVLLLFASSLHAQLVPVARVVVTAPIVANDTSNHADLRIGQQALFTAKAYSASGRPLTNRAVSWSTSMGSVASVSSGRVQGRAAGVAIIRATIGGVSGQATACVLPVTRQAVSVRIARMRWDTVHQVQRVQLAAYLDTLGQHIELTDSLANCLHWKLNAGIDLPTLPAATVQRIGFDGLITASMSQRHFYPSASVGLTPQASVKTFVARDTVRVPAIAISAWRKP